MSDEEVQTKAPAKRGRKPNPEKAAAKKEAAKSVRNGDDGDAPPVKRGRGRPKGSGVKKTTTTTTTASAKSNGTTATKGRRGRSKKEEKKQESSADEDDEEEKSSNEEEDDD